MKKLIISISVFMISLFIFGGNVFALKTSKGEFPDFENNKYYILFYDEIISQYSIAAWDDDTKIAKYSSTSTNYIFRLGIKQIYQLTNNTWLNTGSDNQFIDIKKSNFVATNTNIVGIDENYDTIEAGTGFPLNDIFRNIGLTITKVLSNLGIVMTSLLNNIIFKIMFGIIILFIGIGLIYKLVRKVRK